MNSEKIKDRKLFLSIFFDRNTKSPLSNNSDVDSHPAKSNKDFGDRQLKVDAENIS